MTLLQYYDSVMLPGLLLAQADVTTERLTVDRQIQIRDATGDVIEDLGHETEGDDHRSGIRHLLRLDRDEQAHHEHPADKEAIPTIWQRDGAVLCIGSRGPLDDCGAGMLAQVLSRRGMGARAESYEMLSKSNIDRLDTSATRLVCLSCLDGSSSAYLRFALRRVRRRAPRAKILIGAWWMQSEDSGSLTVHLEDNRPVAEPSATTVVDAARFCLAAASALGEDELSPIVDTDESELSKAS